LKLLLLLYVLGTLTSIKSEGINQFIITLQGS
jgi:hypothetical protein